jgi:acyl-CoA thioester hydrolase
MRPEVDPIRTVSANYPCHRLIPLKFADLAPSGDVSGLAVARLFEEARYTVRSTLDDAQARNPANGFVLARVRIDLLAPLRYPGAVDVAIGVSRPGRTSFDYAAAIFQDGECVALSDATVAVRDRMSGTGSALGPGLRAALEAHAVGVRLPFG